MKRFLSRIKRTKSIFFVFTALLAGVVVIGLYSYFFSSSASAAWYSDSWHFRKKLTIDHTKVSGGSDLSNFPVLVSLSDVSLRNTQSAGNDILFTSSDGSTKLDHEIESFTQSNGTLVAWVRIPTLSASVDTSIYMYYGNPSAADQSNKTGVWDANTLGVWHLKEDPSGTAPQMKNSTSNASIDGTTTGTWTSSQQVTDQIDGSLNFNGTDDYLDAGTSSLLNPSNDMTLETWVKFSQIKNLTLFQKGNTAPPYKSYQLRYNRDYNRFDFQYYDSAQTDITNSANYIPNVNTWYHLVVVRSGTGFKIYINGTDSTSTAVTTSNSIFSSNSALAIGGVNNDWLNGNMDEVRISNTARSAGWITTEYNNQSNPASFFSSIGSEEKNKEPILYLGFNEGQGTTAYDSSPVKNNGTLYGTTKPSWQTEDQCINGKCLYFEGSTAYVGVGSTASNVQSVSLWVRPKTTTQYLMDFDGGTHYISASSGTVSATGFSSPTIYVNSVPNGTLTANTWNHIEVTTGTAFDATNIKVGNVTTNYLNGFIDEVKLYDYVRGPTQVKADYNARGSVKGVSARFGGGDMDYLSNGLVGYWKMDEASWNGTSGEVKDSSGNGINGTAICTGVGCSVPTTGAGKFGNGGANSWNQGISIGSNSSLQPTSTFTLSVWAKISSLAGTAQDLFDSTEWDNNNHGSDTNGYAFFVQSNNTLALHTGNGTTGSTVATSTTIATGSWYHLVATYDQGNVKIYINGQLNTSGTTPNSITYGSTLYGFTLGTLSNSLSYNNLLGTIDEARVYNRALSPKEVSDLYNWAPGPVGYWNFEEGSGGSVNDTSGNSNTGTWNGTGSHWINGKYGKAGNFNGSDDYVDAGSATILDNLPSNGFSGEIWFNVNTACGGAAKHNTLFNKYGAGSWGWFFEVYCNGSNQYQLYFYHHMMPGGTDAAYRGNISISTNTWYHAAFTYNNSTKVATFYLNGSSVTPGAVAVPGAGTDTDDSIGNLKTGGSVDGYFSGKLDDVKIYNYARTQKQIVADMNAGHPNVGSPIGSAVGYWKFDEGYGTTAHNSGSKGSVLDATIANSTWSNSGKFGKALQFNGSTSSVDAGTDSSLSFSNAFTLSTWIMPTNLSAINMALIKNNEYMLRVNAPGEGNTISCFAYIGGTFEPRISSTNVPSTSAWTQVTCTYDGSNLKLYINGVLNATVARTGSITATSNHLFMTGGPAGNFTGYEDEVKVYNYTLTADEVKIEMNRGSAQILGALGSNSSYSSNASNQEYCVPGDTSSCAAPVGRWDFEEKSGSNAYDTSANGHDASLTGTTPTIGKVGYARNFNGGTDDGVVSSHADFDLTATGITLETWVKWNGTTTPVHQNIIHRYDLTGQWIYSLRGYHNGGTNVWRGTINGVDVAADEVSSTSAPVANRWTHVALTYDGTNMKIYINGVLENTTNRGSVTQTSTRQVTIGNDENVNWGFPGIIDQARVYNYARTPAQIAWDYNKGAPVAWWKMDECTGGSVHDSSGNNNTGTINLGTTGTQTTAIGNGTCTTNAQTPWYNGATGKFNSSLNFDGTDDYVSVNDTSALRPGASDFTTAFWFKAANSNQSGSLLSKRLNSGSFNQWQVTTGTTDSGGGLTASKRLSFILINAGLGDWKSYVTANDVIDGNWHHVVVTRVAGSTDTIAMYIDGKNTPLTQTGSTGISPENINNTQPWTIGYNNGSSYFSGQIDDVRIYNYALSSTQVKNLYNNGAVYFGPSTGSP